MKTFRSRFRQNCFLLCLNKQKTHCIKKGRGEVFGTKFYQTGPLGYTLYIPFAVKSCRKEKPVKLEATVRFFFFCISEIREYILAPKGMQHR